MPIILSHNFHSQVTKHESGYWCPQNIGRFFSVLIHELVQKLHDFLFYLTDTTLMQDLAVKTKWPMMRKKWTPCCAFHWMQFINNNNDNNIDSLILSAFLSSMRLFFFSASSSQLLSPPAVRSCHNLQDESTTWLLKETETKSQFNYSKKFKQTRKVHMKQKKLIWRRALARVGSKVWIIIIAYRLKWQEESKVKFLTGIKSGLLKASEHHLSLRKEYKLWNTDTTSSKYLYWQGMH